MTARAGGAGGKQGAGWVEIVATVLLALAAVATAWSSYQANRWNGEQAKAAARVNALRIEGARAQGLAQAQTQVDIAMFFQWVNATETDDPDLAGFYQDRFRPEFQPAFDAWLASDPLTNPDAPPTPFAMDEYQLQARADSEASDAEAARDRRPGPPLHPNLSQLCARHRPLRRRVVLRWDERQATRCQHQESAAPRRLSHLHRHRHMDRHIPSRPIRLTGGRGD